MKFREIPGTGVNASVVGFGLWGISGQWEGGANDYEAVKALHAAIDSGINFFDTAPVYGLGHAEEVLGKALESRRNEVLIASKCGLVWGVDEDVKRNLTRDSILTEIDQSLSRLGTDRIDLWQIHWPSDEMILEETMEAMLTVKSAGKVRWLGVSNFSASDTRRAKELADIVSWQGLYNAIERNSTEYRGDPLDYRTEADILPVADELNIGILPFSPLMMGLLAGAVDENKAFGDDDVRSGNPRIVGKESEQYFKATRAFLSFAEELGKPPAELAINWLLSHRSLLSVISGARNVSEAIANAQAAEWELGESDIEELEIRLAPWKDLYQC